MRSTFARRQPPASGRAAIVAPSSIASALSFGGAQLPGSGALYSASSARDRGSAQGSDMSQLDACRRLSRGVWVYSNISRGLERFIEADIIGPGLRLCLPPSIPRDDADKIASRWSEWAEDCGGGPLPLRDLARLALVQAARDGDAPIEITTGRRMQPRLRLLEADAIASHHAGSVPVPDAARRAIEWVRHGVALDRMGRAVGYIVDLSQMESAWTAAAAGPPGAGPRFVPADSMILFGLPASSQVPRGLPALAGICYKLLALEENDRNRLFSSNKESSIFAFLETSVADSGGAIPQDDWSDPMAPPAPDSGGEPVSSTRRFDNGLQVVSLAPGVSARILSSSQRSGEVNEMVKGIVARACAAIGLPAQTLTRDYRDPGFATPRMVQVQERQYISAAMARLTDQLLRPVWRRWAPVALADMPIPEEMWGQLLAGARFESLPADWLDPRAAAAASTQSIASGVSSRARELAARGMTLDDLYRDRAAEIEIAESHGVDPIDDPASAPSPMPSHPPPTAGGEGAPDDDDDEDEDNDDTDEDADEDADE